MKHDTPTLQTELERLRNALRGSQQGAEEARKCIRKLERQLEDEQESTLSAAIARMEAVSLNVLEDVYFVNASMGNAQLPDDHWKAKYEETLNILESFKASHEIWMKETEWVQESELGQVGQHRIHIINEYIKKLRGRAEKAEAELARVTSDRDFYINQALRQSKLCKLRPLSAAGDVPDGCVRVFCDVEHDTLVDCDTDRWINAKFFADIRLPEKQAEENPWIEHNGGDCPLNDDEVEEWEYKMKLVEHIEHIKDPSGAPSEYNWGLNGDGIFAYRVMKWKTDPYAALKKAHAEGKVIQMKLKDEPRDFWEDITNPGWGGDPDEYRIKPTPETFEAHGKVWTRHTPGDPMPCDGDRMVYILTSKAGESELAYEAFSYDWTITNSSWWGEIIGWRYAYKTPTIATLAQDQIDLTPQQQSAVDAVLNEELGIPPPWQPKVGDVVRLKGGGLPMTVKTHSMKIYTCAWFDLNGYKQEDFHVDCLKLTEDEQ